MLVISRAMSHFAKRTTTVYSRTTKEAGIFLEICYYKQAEGWLIRVVDDTKPSRRIPVLRRCDTPKEFNSNYAVLNGDLFTRT